MAYFPFRNLGLKFFSICIATLLWLIIAGDRVVERAMRVPIEFQNLPSGLEIVGEPLNAVEVRLRGSSGTLGRLSASDTSAVVDLRNARPGRRLFHLASSQVNVPYGVEVVQVAPATLSIEFENSVVKVLQIRPSVEGKPAPGYEVLRITSDPPTVEAIGPESSLRGLDEAMTEPISVADGTRPVREVVTVGVADPNVRLRTPQAATVTVQIGPGSSRRTMADVPVEIVNIDGGLQSRAIPQRVSVTLRGTRDTIQLLRDEDIKAHVDAASLAAGDHSLDVKVEAPPGVTVDTVEPHSVRVRIFQS